MAKHAIQPNYANRMRCVAIARHSGKLCGQLAMRGVPCCRWHGGNMMQARLKSLEAKRNAGKTQPAGRYSATRFKRAGELYSAANGES